MRQSLLVAGLIVGVSIALVSAQGRGFGPSKAPSALRAIPAETTAAKAKDPNWKAPRTAWGHPDLEGTWSSDDMRGIPVSRPAPQADRENLTPEEFARRAGGDEASRDRAVNEETFLRNEFGVRDTKSPRFQYCELGALGPQRITCDAARRHDHRIL